MRRTADGYRLGEDHHKATASDAVVEEARKLREQGRTYRDIGWRLGVPWRTVVDWVNYKTR